MAVIVQAPPYATFLVEFQESLTVGELIQQVKDANGLEFRGSHSVQDAMDGHTCSDSEIVIDDRIYYLTAAIVS